MSPKRKLNRLLPQVRKALNNKGKRINIQIKYTLIKFFTLLFFVVKYCSKKIAHLKTKILYCFSFSKNILICEP